MISEVVHSADDRYQQGRFVSKYGKEPLWSTGESYSYNHKPSILGLFFYSFTMPQDLKAQLKAFVPPPEPTRIASVESVPDILSRTEKEYGYNNCKCESRLVELPLHIRETESLARREDLDKITISDKTFYSTGTTLSAIVHVLESGDYYSD